jgi:hypothetical protein
MKCESVQTLLARFVTGELRPRFLGDIESHLSECARCRETLAFHRALESQFDCVVEPPLHLYSRASALTAAPARLALLTRVLGDSTMKKILVSSALVTVLATSMLFLGPRNASASTPQETFRSMRAGLAKSIENGNLAFDLKANEDGSITVAGKLSGRPLPPDFPVETEVTRDGDIFDVTLIVDFSTSNYSAISFGKDGSLVLAPRAKQGERYAIALDPASKEPRSWTTFSLERGAWKVKSRYDFKPEAAAPTITDEGPLMKVRVRMLVNRTATIRYEPSK